MPAPSFPAAQAAQHRTWRFWLLLCALAATPLSVQAEDEELLRQPLLHATYWADSPETPSFIRDEPLPALRLSAGHSPDPRLPADGWRVRWQGVLEVLHPGSYHFTAEASGALNVRIGDHAVVSTPAAGGTVVSDATELAFGLHDLEVEFIPSPGNVILKLDWSSDQFTREPLPAHAVGHVDPSQRNADPFNQGWLAVEEHNCIACHSASPSIPISQQLSHRPGPNLTVDAPRLRAAWIYHWLEDPQAWRPEAVMPHLFPPDHHGQVQRYAVARYLGRDDQPHVVPADDALLAAGERLFATVGCTACHVAYPGQPARATLQRLHEKTTPESLATFIQQPSHIDPAGRMPALGLSDDEAQQLAVYLYHRDLSDQPLPALPAAPTTVEIDAAFAALSTDITSQRAFAAAQENDRLHHLARAVLQTRHCTACHEVRATSDSQPWPPQTTTADFAKVVAQSTHGCLANDDSHSPHVPRFGSSLPRVDVRDFLAAAHAAPGTPSPTLTAARQLERLNCTACHQRNETGGLHPDLLASLMAGQTDENAESLAPPPLTGAADKLTGEYLRGVLIDGRRARPWMSLRMPHFRPNLVADLPAGLAALDGDSLIESPRLPTVDRELAAAGRQLVGTRGFGCIKCHDLLDVESGGTRGPNLAGVPARVNYDWYLRWMTDPQRMQPGTRMPTVFLDGQSPYPDILGGSPQRQREALWHYFLSCRDLPYPEGLRDDEPKFYAPTIEPLLVRTFLPGTTPRGIAIRFPNRTHLAYDVQSCRLVYAWQGDFLDMTPLWTERGGREARLLGDIFWRAPTGFPWDVTSTTTEPPDFRGRDTDPQFGAAHPRDGRHHPSRLRLIGYHTSPDAPTFQFEFRLPNDARATFQETVRALSLAGAQGVQRETQVVAPPGQTIWFNAARADEAPTWNVPDGSSGQLTSEPVTLAADSLIRVVTDGQPHYLQSHATSRHAAWRAVEQDGVWRLLLTLPTERDSATADVALTIWTLRDGTPDHWDSARAAARSLTSRSTNSEPTE